MKIHKDKLQHIAATFVMTAVVCFIFHACGVSMTASTFAGLVAGIALGCGKEYGDRMAAGNYWDWNDIIADIVGAAIGALVHFVTHLIL